MKVFKGLVAVVALSLFLVSCEEKKQEAPVEEATPVEEVTVVTDDAADVVTATVEVTPEGETPAE